MSAVRGRRDRVIVTANPSKLEVRDRSSSDEVEIVSSNPIERYNHFIRQYNRECNKVNCFTLRELPLIDLTGEATQREIENLARIFQANHDQVQYNRCYERMTKVSLCENKDQYFQFVTSEEEILLEGESGNWGFITKTLKSMQYTQRWVDKNNKAFNKISSFVNQNTTQNKLIHA